MLFIHVDLNIYVINCTSDIDFLLCFILLFYFGEGFTLWCRDRKNTTVSETWAV